MTPMPGGSAEIMARHCKVVRPLTDHLASGSSATPTRLSGTR